MKEFDKSKEGRVPKYYNKKKIVYLSEEAYAALEQAAIKQNENKVNIIRKALSEAIEGRESIERKRRISLPLSSAEDRLLKREAKNKNVSQQTFIRKALDNFFEKKQRSKN